MILYFPHIPRPKKVEGMADKALKDLTVIQDVTGKALIPVSVPGFVESNNVPIEVLLGKSLIFRGEIHSFDEVFGMGIYMNMNTASDYPGSNPYGMLVVFSGSGMIVQLYINTTSTLFVRQFSSEVWSGWKAISFT